MDLEHLPLLDVQRDLYRLPRGMERFKAYLANLIDKDADDIKLPLSAMNPMGKDHLPAFLDALLAMDAETAAARAVERCGRALAGEPGSYRVCLVVSDDLGGGWTDRHASELAHRMDPRAMHKRGWVTVILWTTESYTPAKVEAETAACLFRAAYAGRYGYAKTLGDVMKQEGYAMASAAGLTKGYAPRTDEEDARGREAGLAAGAAPSDEELEYTREVLRPLRGNTDAPTLIAALFGDAAAKKLGHAPLGLSERAGLALAMREALGR
jgi:hypothetical protein